MDFFAETFSRYWFVFVILLLVGGVAATSARQSRRRLVARLSVIVAGLFIVLGLLALLLE